MDPAGPGGQLGGPLLGGDGEPGLPTRPVELGQLGRHLGGVAERVDPLVAVDDVAEHVRRHGRPLARAATGVGLSEGPVDLAGELLQAVDCLIGPSRAARGR